MKKVAIFIDNFNVYGGVERVTANMATELAKYSDIFIIACQGGGKDEKIQWYPDSVRFIGLDIYPFHIFRDFYRIRKIICDVVNANGFDIVILQTTSSGFFGRDIKRFTKAKVISSDHGYIFFPDNKKKKKNLITIWRAAWGADSFVVLTERCRNEYKKKFHIQPDKIKVIPNWADDVVREPEYNIESKRIISVGRFDVQKGFDLLIESFSFVHRNNPDWKLDIYGDGEEKGNIEHLIIEYGLNDFVTLKGKRLDVKDLYAGYSLYVMSSRYEGLPMVLLEAKQNYLPIVSFDIDAGPRDVIEDGVNGLLVKSGDTKALADAMCKMIENPDLRKRMSENSQFGMEKFSKDKVLSEWLDVLQIAH